MPRYSMRRPFEQSAQARFQSTTGGLETLFVFSFSNSFSNISIPFEMFRLYSSGSTFCFSCGRPQASGFDVFSRAISRMNGLDIFSLRPAREGGLCHGLATAAERFELVGRTERARRESFGALSEVRARHYRSRSRVPAGRRGERDQEASHISSSLFRTFSAPSASSGATKAHGGARL